jgi:hypothetical protein
VIANVRCLIVTLRKFNLSFIVLYTVGLLYFFSQLAFSWVYLIFFIPVPFIVFDGGRADAIDKIYSLTKHLKYKSLRSNLFFLALASQRLRNAHTHLLFLKYEFPDESELLSNAEQVLLTYLRRRNHGEIFNDT